LRKENLELADKIAQLTSKLEGATAAAAAVIASTTNGTASSTINSRAFKGKGTAAGPGDAAGSADVYKTLLDQVRGARLHLHDPELYLILPAGCHCIISCQSDVGCVAWICFGNA
jgi:hypothetical protein